MIEGLTEEEYKSIEWTFSRTKDKFILGYYIDSSSSIFEIKRVIFIPKIENETECKVVFLNNPNKIHLKFYGNFQLTYEKAVDTLKNRYQSELYELKKRYSLYC